MNQTVLDLLNNIHEALNNKALAPATRNKILHETLVIICAEGLKDTYYGFGDLNSQLESLIRILRIPIHEANALRKARRDSNRSRPLLPEDLQHDAEVLEWLVRVVWKCETPEQFKIQNLKFKIGASLKPQTSILNTQCLRCLVCSFDKRTIKVFVDEDGEQDERTVLYAEPDQYARMEYLYKILKPNMHLNLLDCKYQGKAIKPRLIIVEPDCLMDISVIASCFEDYGHHPLMYLLSRMKGKTNTQATLLGNYAGTCLDDIINNPDFSAAKTLIRNFHEKALEYATCTDFDGKKFKADAARQAQSLVGVVDELSRHYDLSKAILEPTFVCEKLGLQGRVDLMTTDFRLLVEQKSGRNIFLERGTKNAHGGRVVEKHYVQVLLYYGIIYYNFHVRRPDIYFLYSKYPLPDGLLGMAPLMKLLYEALRFRNEAIALEFDIAENGMEYILPQLTEQTLNAAHASGFFYDVYLRPPLVGLLSPLQHLSPLEKSYFCRMIQFVVRENILSRVGVVEGTGSCVANLWNMPLAEKIETGNIYNSLTLSGTEGEAVLSFSVPDQGDDFLPNFRRGDMVYVYSYPEDEEPDVRKAILYKGTMAEITTHRVTVQLAESLPTEPSNLPHSPSQLYAIEHASSDVGGGAAIRSLYALITASQDRKDLLLGTRPPKGDKTMTLTRSYHPVIDDIILRAKQANDFFLLVGPPGTGKTSMALQYMVREALASPSPDGATSLLLMSYTNRAVDEICGMLRDNGIDFLRIGNDLSCAESFVPDLLQNRVGEKPTLTAMRQLITDARIIIGTTSMIQSRSYLFNLKHFSLAIVDEASQILEPNIIGLLARKEIDKFILIGDYKQLPAVVQQGDADCSVNDPILIEAGITDCKASLFERLIRQETKAGRTDFIGTLRRQGRMHPEIAEFPNREFYTEERLEAVPLPHQSATSLSYGKSSQDAVDDLLKIHRLLFFPSKDCRQPEISDKVNADEARIVADLLRRIHRFYGDQFNADKTVGVIVPYRNQIAMIRKEIERTGIDGLEGVSIDTVERYQGSQRDVIIYSFTIQRHYQLDFLTANTFTEGGHTIDRKLNVALTRARKQLILTGNPHTLSASPLFAELMSFVSHKGGYVEQPF